MIVHSGNYSDIQKYYLGTVVKLSITGDRLQKICEVHEDEITLVDVDGMEITIDLSEPYEIDYPLPTRAVYQMGKSAVMLARRPAQQYYRGIHEKNTSLQYLNSTGEWRPMAVTLENLQQFVDKPCYHNIEFGFDWEPYQSYALDNVFSVSKSLNIFALASPIAQMNPNTKSVLCTPLFRTELQQLFPKDWTINV
jgi:hypothetical protein